MMKHKLMDYLHIMGPAYMPYHTHPAPHLIAGSLRDAGYAVDVAYSSIDALEFLVRKHPDGERLLEAMKMRIGTVDDFTVFVEAKKRIREILDAESKTFGNGERFTYVHNHVKYAGKYNSNSIAGLVEAAKNPNESIFCEYVEKELIPHLVETQPKLIGFTITDSSQAAFPLVVAGLIKGKYREQLPDTKIVLGGYLVSVNKESFAKPEEKPEISEFFSYVDFLMHNEAESAVVKLMEHIEGRIGKAEVPKLIYFENGKVKMNSLDENGLIVPEKMDAVNPDRLSAPFYTEKNFAQLHLPVDGKEMSLIINRGCPFRCSFCGIDKTYDGLAIWIDNQKRLVSGTLPLGRQKYRLITNRSIDKLLDDVEPHCRKNGVVVLSLGDERIPPQQMLTLSEKIAERKLRIAWSAYATLDREFMESDFCQTLAKGGCRFLQFGLETISAKSLKATNKGQNIATLDSQKTIFENLFNAGIMPHVFLMIRLPQQMNVDLLATLSYLSDISPCVLTIKPTTAKVTKQSMDAIKPSDTDLRVKEDANADFSPNVPFETGPGRISRKDADAWKIVMDAWVALRHPPNLVTKELAYSQRLSAGMETVIRLSDELRTLKETGDLPGIFSRLDGESFDRGERKVLDAFRKVALAVLEELCDPNRTPELDGLEDGIRTKSIAAVVEAAHILGNWQPAEKVLKKHVQDSRVRAEILEMAGKRVQTANYPFEQTLLNACMLFEKAGRGMLAHLVRDSNDREGKVGILLGIGEKKKMNDGTGQTSGFRMPH